MSKKSVNKNQTQRLVLNIIFGILIGASIITVIVGLVGMTGLNQMQDKEYLQCETKDYSSYVKTNVTTTPGNDEINSQIELYKNAMEKAANANDWNAYGQLNAEYTKLLSMQAQTSTSHETKDYTEAEKAKKNCYALAFNHKESEQTKNTWIMGIGGACAVISIIAMVSYNIIVSRKS